MSVFVAYSAGNRPEIDSETTERIGQLCGDDAEWDVDDTVAVCTPSTRRVDVSTETDDGVSVVYGDAYRSEERFSAADLGGLAAEEFEDVNGEFIAVLKRDDGLRIVTDRLNLRQLFVYETDGLFVGSSSVAAMLQFLADVGHTQDLSFDRQALNEFLDFGHFLGTKTHFAEISLLPGATVLDVEGGQGTLTYRRSTYWEYQYGEYYEDRETAVRELTEAFEAAVSLRASGGDRHGLHLSGGLDSRMILAAAPSAAEVVAYSFGVPGNDESRIASLAARVADREFRFFPLDNYLREYAERAVTLTDGQVPIHHFHHLPSMDEVARDCDEIFVGTLLGELLGGSKLKPEMLDGKYSATKLYSSTSVFSSRLWDDVFNGVGYFDQRISMDSIAEEHRDETTTVSPNEMDGWNVRNRQARFIFQGGTRSINEYIPVSTPVSDRRLIEAALKLPPNVRVRDDVRRDMLSRLDSRMTLIPYAANWAPPRYQALKYITGAARLVVKNKSLRRRLPFVSNEVRLGYPDYAEWLREDDRLYSFVAAKLRSFCERGVCRERPLMEALRTHKRGDANYLNEILNVVTLEVWLEYVDDVPGTPDIGE